MDAQYSSDRRFRKMAANLLSIFAILAIAVPAVWSPANAAIPRNSSDDQPPETYQVNVADDNDDGTCDADHCSLREAINAANAHPGADTITFNIGEGPATIQPLSGLPSIADPVTLDGTTQPGFEGSPIVELDGSGVAGDADGLVISAGTSTVRGLVINRWPGTGIILLGSYDTGTGGNLIEDNFVGTDISGSSAAPNRVGIYAFDSSGNTIRGNLLSGNTVGIGINGTAGLDNVVTGNRIGTSADGMTAVPNTIGVLLEESASNNTIGGTSDEDRNIISGNDQDGIWIKDLDTDENVVQGNYIGTDASGAAALANGVRGVYIYGVAKDNLIAANVISGNGAAGVRIGDQGTMGNKVQGNYIGTDLTGTLPLGNGYVGVRIGDGATENVIGGTEQDAGNLISANKADGVLIDGEATSANVVQGNRIGTDVSGTATLGATGPAVGGFSVTAEEGTCPTYPAETDNDGFVSASDDPLAPWSGTSVTFKGTDACTNGVMLGASSLIYRYRVEFDEVTQLNSIAVTGAAFNGPDSVLRVLDEGMNELAISSTAGGNSYWMNYVVVPDVEGKVFYVEEYDTSSAWRFRESVLINAVPLANLGNGVLLASGATENLIGGAEARNVISGNLGNGVAVFNPGTARNTVQGNLIGTDTTGTQALGNHAPGVGIGDQASYNVIGGADAGNVISGNAAPGVAINNPGTEGNIVQGNTIGADMNGAAPLPNAGMGIWVGEGAQNTLIGGTEAGQGNLISGNRSEGISINDPATAGTLVQGNYIGTDRDGTSALPNGVGGIFVRSNLTQIGGTEAGAGNVISANGWAGVWLESGASGNSVQGNLIGTDKTGTTTISANAPAAPPSGVSVDLACPTYPAETEFDGFTSQSDDPMQPWSGTSVTFKGTDECPGGDNMFGASSLIYRYRIDFAEVTELRSIAVTGAAFNGPDNVLRVLDEGMNELAFTWTNGGNSYRTNYLILQGVSGQAFYLEEYDTSSSWRFRESIVVNGPLPLGNRGPGVFLASGATSNLIGGADAAARNIISGNLENGVSLYDAGTTGNTLAGNYIGTDVSGTQALGNAGAGVGIGGGASTNLIGAVGAGNLVSGNSDGVSIYDLGTDGNIVRSNMVGTDASGSVVLPNLGAGIWVGGGPSGTVIGGAEEGAGNLVSGNGTHGVSINWPDTTGTRVLGNYIGTDKNGTSALSNGAGGVYVSSPETWIGAPEAGNLISGNDGLAIYFGGADEQGAAHDGFVQGNLIGTDASGAQPLPNGGGVYLDAGIYNTMIGGTEPGAANVIANNWWVGIGTAPNAGLSNAFLSNLVFSNGFGIDLAVDGPTLNDVRDRDTGPNNLQNFPVLSRPKIVDGQLRVAGSLSSNANTTYRLEFFSVPACDASGYGQGQVFLGSGQVTTGAGGSADFAFLLPPNIPAGWLVTSTATNPSGNTSEFSMCTGPAK